MAENSVSENADVALRAIQDDIDLSNPKSIVNMAPEPVKSYILRLTEEELAKDEEVLEKELGWDGKTGIPEFANIFRQNFWDEYDHAIKHNNLTMRPRWVYHGLTNSWIGAFLRHPPKVSWLIKMPRPYEVSLKEIHLLGLKQMRYIMAFPLTESNGKINVKLGELKFKILQHVDTRLHGAVVQRIEQKSINLNASMPEGAKLVQEESVAVSMDDIERRLAKLRGESKLLESPGNVQVDLMAPLVSSASDVIQELKGAGIMNHAPKKASEDDSDEDSGV